eukprot:Tamp_17586.p1 GENE.Tamp_17586~~Tamp_17586.p1  ORF type:complete len:364 (-),score=57.01 Tamp_17586:290-1381(-)
MLAASKGCGEDVRRCFAAGARVDARDGLGRTALHWAARTAINNETNARILIHHGADVNAQDHDGWTSLTYASFYGRVSVVRFLLRHGADVNLLSWGLRRALHWAADRGQVACVQALVAAGAHIPYQDVHGDDALEIARARGHKVTEGELLNSLRATGKLDLDTLVARAEPEDICGGLFWAYDVHPENPIAKMFQEAKARELCEGWPPRPPDTANMTALFEHRKWFIKDFEHEQLLLRKTLFREAGLPEHLAADRKGEAIMPPACMRRYKERMRQKELKYERKKGRKHEPFDLEKAYQMLAKSPGFEEFHDTPIDENGAKAPLYPVPKGFPNNVNSSKSLEDRMLRFYKKQHASRGRGGKNKNK